LFIHKFNSQILFILLPVVSVRSERYAPSGVLRSIPEGVLPERDWWVSTQLR